MNDNSNLCQLNVKGIPEDLLDQFANRCYEANVSMNKAIVGYIRQVVANDIRLPAFKQVQVCEPRWVQEANSALVEIEEAHDE